MKIANMTFSSKFSVKNIKVIPNDLGDVLKVTSTSEESYKAVGEAYFSEIRYGAIKGWKRHNEITCNLVVPYGAVKFVLAETYSDGGGYLFHEVISGRDTYKLLTIYPGTWFAFKGLHNAHSLVLNLASAHHDPAESSSKLLDNIYFDWS